MSNSPHNSLNWLLLFLLTIIWGASYILIKKGLLAFTPVELACMRISISFIASIPIAIIALRKTPREKYLTILSVGVFGNGLPAFLFALSLTKSGSAVNGILNSLSPLWTLIVGFYFFSVAITTPKIAGVVIGFVGALVLVLGRKDGDFHINALYSLLPVMATLCYGISSNITKQKLQQSNPVYITSISMMMIGIPALTGLCFTNAPAKIMSGEHWLPFISIAVLSIFGTLIAWMLFYKLVQRTDALFAASVTYLVPIVAIGWGLFDGEILYPLQFAGMILILIGVYFTTRSVKPLNQS